jgi:integrase
MWDIDLSKPMAELKNAWIKACHMAGVRYRWHDLRHSFISRLAESSAVSEDTIRSLAGHVSRKMLERYSQIQEQAKQGYQSARISGHNPIFRAEWAQKGAQFRRYRFCH